MAKLIHLSLLLAATAQLPMCSVTKIFIPNEKEVTFKFPPNWTVEYCCKDNRCKFVEENAKSHKVRANSKSLTIESNPNQQSNGNYSCYGVSDPTNHTDLLLCLKITGCQNPHSCRIEFLDRLHLTGDDCKGSCLDGTKQTFNLISPENNNECFLNSSCEHVAIQLKNPSFSGDCLSNSYNENYVEHDADLQFYRVNKSWIDALEHCQNQESSLLQITDQTVQTRMKSFLRTKYNSMKNGAWIGLERSIFGNSIPWRWISGSEVEDNSIWNKSFPVDALNHHCGKIIWVEKSDQFKALDASCHDMLPFICQTATT